MSKAPQLTLRRSQFGCDWVIVDERGLVVAGISGNRELAEAKAFAAIFKMLDLLHRVKAGEVVRGEITELLDSIGRE